MRIKVIFTTKEYNPFSWVIRFFDSSDFSHAAFLVEYEVHNKKNYIIHASGTNVHKTYVNDFKDKIVQTIDLELSINEISGALNLFNMYMHTKFDFMSIIGIGFNRILRVFGYKIKNIFADQQKTLFCSEFVAIVLKQIGVDLKDFNLELDGPKKLYEVLKCSHNG